VIREARGRIAAVLFDMDGVVTDTARAHAAVWKRLFDEYLASRGEGRAPFDAREDYRRYVDGKPRYDGVASFLAARGITLPHGAEGDSPDSETVCGLGNRKNLYFAEWLSENRITPFPGTLRLIARLREAGVRLAVFSASRNAERVLRSAGALDLFGAKVDGRDMAALGLPGKPDPAIMLRAAAALGVAPGAAAVIEDALAGVEAGARGGFAQVIGVAREGGAKALFDAGADLVVADPGDLAFDPARGVLSKTPRNAPEKH
jgi:beta-phosphoglucomutase family hydrolase